MKILPKILQTGIKDIFPEKISNTTTEEDILDHTYTFTTTIQNVPISIIVYKKDKYAVVKYEITSTETPEEFMKKTGLRLRFHANKVSEIHDVDAAEKMYDIYMSNHSVKPYIDSFMRTYRTHISSVSIQPVIYNKFTVQFKIYVLKNSVKELLQTLLQP